MYVIRGAGGGGVGGETDVADGDEVWTASFFRDTLPLEAFHLHSLRLIFKRKPSFALLTQSHQEQLYPQSSLQSKELLRYYNCVTKSFPSMDERACRSTALILQNCAKVSRPYNWKNLRILNNISWRICQPPEEAVINNNGFSNRATVDDRETLLFDQTILWDSLPTVLCVEHWDDTLLCDDDEFEITIEGKSLNCVLDAIWGFYQTEDRFDGMMHTYFEGFSLRNNGKWDLCLVT
ncbi:hypothetical protein CDEST_15437 [Colletotrichum destructivum]|uniref:Uncharacterized protein n=1 Tax=Colletotrichum destructivum TaxID=34406 RepID=A0AAX4J4X3_9PEZI|nr:hypothetical protein CDEST_15437 [Colletotrichum destructivum]